MKCIIQTMRQNGRFHMFQYVEKIKSLSTLNFLHECKIQCSSTYFERFVTEMQRVHLCTLNNNKNKHKQTYTNKTRSSKQEIINMECEK